MRVGRAGEEGEGGWKEGRQGKEGPNLVINHPIPLQTKSGTARCILAPRIQSSSSRGKCLETQLDRLRAICI